MPIDALIVGQGLAGSLLAWELIRHGWQVMVIDSGGDNASQVAAGLINPVTGQRLVKSRDIEHCLPAAMAVYAALAEQFKQAFFVPMPMLRVLKNTKEQQLAEQRLDDPDYRDYLSGLTDTDERLTSSFGILKQLQTGYLRTQPLLQQLRDFFIVNGRYRQTKLDYADIAIHPGLRWRDWQPRHIVFCEGHQATMNPWFGVLPFQLAKGEILSCKTAAAVPEQIANYGYWLIPGRQQVFKTGATFAVDFQDDQPTLQAKHRLLEALAVVCPQLSELDVVEHRAGIRPTTLDKQPFIGSHPKHASLHIFNGFGAKGSLMIPWYARQFAQVLNQQASLPAHCDIRRYHDTHFPA